MDRTEKSREPEGFRFLLCPFFPEAAEGCSAGARHFGRRMFPPDAIKREKTGGKWRTVSQERRKREAAEDSVEHRERKVGNREGRWRIEKFF